MFSKLPLYKQVKIDIQNNIIKKLNPHEKLPSEHILMEQFGVSRTTIRKALMLLEQEGFIYKEHGIGTFVSDEKIQQELKNYAGFTQQMKSMGYEVTYQVLECDILKNDSNLENKLNLAKGEELFYLRRKAFRDGEIINVTESYIPYAFVKGIEQYDFNQHSLYSVLEGFYQFKIKRTTREITAIIANYEIAKILEIREGNPILEFEGYVTAENKDKQEVFMEYFKTFYRTDDTKFIMTQSTE